MQSCIILLRAQSIASAETDWCKNWHLDDWLLPVCGVWLPVCFLGHTWRAKKRSWLFLFRVNFHSSWSFSSRLRRGKNFLTYRSLMALININYVSYLSNGQHFQWSIVWFNFYTTTKLLILWRPGQSKKYNQRSGPWFSPVLYLLI